MTKQKALLELIFAGVLWGFGFTGTQWVLEGMSPELLMVSRMGLATFFGVILCLAFEYFPQKNGFVASLKPMLVPGFYSGLALGAFMLVQTIGLQYTSATNSGFLTCLYVVLVPIFGALFLRHQNSPGVWGAVVLAGIGSYVLMGAGLTRLNEGDLWTILCAMISTFHILYLGHVSHKISKPWFFNVFQSFVAGIVCLPFVKSFHIELINARVVWGLLILSLGCSAIGFAIQVRTQRVLAPTIVSLLFLLESPFAMLFDILLQGKWPNGFQVVGSALIIVSAVIAISIPSKHQFGHQS